MIRFILDHEGGALIMGLVPESEEEEDPSPSPGACTKERPCEDPERRWLSASQEVAFSSHQIYHILIIDFPASRTVRNKCLFLKPLGLWYFVIAYQAD